MALGCVFRPKSLLVALIDVRIYFFQTHFDRGLKVRTFCSRHTGRRWQAGRDGFIIKSLCLFSSTCCISQPSATSPLFFDNLHFEHFDKSVNHESRLTLLSKCSKWRLSKNRGLVADGWYFYVFHHEHHPSTATMAARTRPRCRGCCTVVSDDYEVA